MAERSTLAERSFERLAKQRGDITEDVLERYYTRYPDGRASFEHHGLGNRAELEGRMISTTAFLLMQWAQDPASTRIEQGTTIVHHQDTLEIGPRLYLGLIDAVLEVLFETIPEDSAEERAFWLSLRGEIAGFIDSVRPEFWREDKDGPLRSPPYAETITDPAQ